MVTLIRKKIVVYTEIMIEAPFFDIIKLENRGGLFNRITA